MGMRELPSVKLLGTRGKGMPLRAGNGTETRQIRKRSNMESREGGREKAGGEGAMGGSGDSSVMQRQFFQNTKCFRDAIDPANRKCHAIKQPTTPALSLRTVSSHGNIDEVIFL
jgi:hypothetical protein